MPKRATPFDRFAAKIRINLLTMCWIWTGSRDGQPRKGNDARGTYGKFSLDGMKMMAAHRASYLLFKGPIAAGLQVCHRCDNPVCVNPDHLFLGTVQNNMDDQIAKGRAWFQKATTKPPRLGGGVGRMVVGKGCVVDTECTICGAAMLQRITANRQGKAPTCSIECKAEHIARKKRSCVQVPCAECGAPTVRPPSILAKHTAHCSRSCSGKSSARKRWHPVEAL